MPAIVEYVDATCPRCHEIRHYCECVPEQPEGNQLEKALKLHKWWTGRLNDSLVEFRMQQETVSDAIATVRAAQKTLKEELDRLDCIRTDIAASRKYANEYRPAVWE
jgi:hypothetical protein